MDKVRRVVTYYDEDSLQICRDEWQDYHGNGHKAQGPSFQSFDKNGNITEERWMLKGNFHREGNLPAHVYYRTQEGRTFPINETYYLQNMISNPDGPAQLEYHNDGTIRLEKWIKDNYQNRTDGPAEIYYNPDGSILAERWYLAGQLNRAIGPAWVDYDDEGEMSASMWYENGHEKPKPKQVAAPNLISADTLTKLNQVFAGNATEVTPHMSELNNLLGINALEANPFDHDFFTDDDDDDYGEDDDDDVW